MRCSGKQLRPDRDRLWCTVGLVDGMPRAGSHYNLGTSRGPDKIGSRACLSRSAVCQFEYCGHSEVSLTHCDNKT